LIKEKAKTNFWGQFLKIFALPFLLFLLMTQFEAGSGTQIILGLLIFAYSVIVGILLILIYLIKYLIRGIRFFFRLKGIKIHLEGKQLSLQILVEES